MTVQPCEKCGQSHVTRRASQACKGHRRNETINGQRVKLAKPVPCKRAPLRGQEVCAAHGGKAPQNLAAAKTQLAIAEAEKLAQTFGAPVADVDPGDVILERISAMAGHVRWLHGKVQALSAEDLVWGVTKETEGDVVVGNGPTAQLDKAQGVVREAKPSIWEDLYYRWSGKLEKLCIEAVRIGLKEREVRLAERMGDALAGLIDGVLADLGHNPNDPAVAEVVVRRLRLLPGGAA